MQIKNKSRNIFQEPGVFVSYSFVKMFCAILLLQNPHETKINENSEQKWHLSLLSCRIVQAKKSDFSCFFKNQ
jgi:hypothetical protein